MKHLLGLVVVFATSLSIAQSAAPIQFTQIPQTPSCDPGALPLFGGGPDCQSQWNFYNQAVQQRRREEMQVYVNRQKEIAASQATAPLQQQVADLNKLVTDQQSQIKKLNDQIQTDSAAALQQKADDANTALQAKKTGLEQGAGIGAGATLVLLGLIFGIKRFASNFTVTKKPQAKAASA